MKTTKAEVAAPAPGKENGKFDDYELSSMADTLSRAEEIKADPHKAKAVHKHLKKKQTHIAKSISSIGEMRKAASERMEELSEENDD